MVWLGLSSAVLRFVRSSQINLCPTPHCQPSSGVVGIFCQYPRSDTALQVFARSCSATDNCSLCMDVESPKVSFSAPLSQLPFLHYSFISGTLMMTFEMNYISGNLNQPPENAGSFANLLRSVVRGNLELDEVRLVLFQNFPDALIRTITYG